MATCFGRCVAQCAFAILALPGMRISAAPPGNPGDFRSMVPRHRHVVSGEIRHEALRREEHPFGPFTWQTATPESQGMSSAKLDALKDELAKRKTRAFVVVRNDKIVYEWYAQGVVAASKQGTASLAKAIVGGLSLGAGITDGRINLDDLAMKYIPEWKHDPKKSKITIRHLGSHTSGLADSATPGVKHEDQPSWMGEFWRRLPPPNDPFTLARDKAPMLFDPGTKLQYSNPAIGMMTYCVTAAIQKGEQKDVRSLLKDRVLQPIGVKDADWSVGYGKTFTVNDLPLIGSWGGGSFTPRATARIGRLLQREGDWDGNRVLSKEAVRQITGDAGLPGHCGMGFWTNADGRYATVPNDTYYGAGAGDQLLVVIPSLSLIVVRNGEALEPEPKNPKDVFEAYHDQRVKILFEPVIEAITDRPKEPRPADTRGEKPAVDERGRSKLTVQAGEKQVTVTCNFAPGWKAVIDGERGGVVTEFRLPANGDNLVSNDGTRFEGLFNLIYAQFKETGKDGAYVAKGAIYSFGKLSKLTVLEKSADRVVVEVEGKSGNQVAPRADVLRYRQRYTFLADRIVCDGEVQWLLGGTVPESHPEMLQLQCLFAPGAVSQAMRVWSATAGPLNLPLTNSKGSNYPAGIEYPLTVEVPLKSRACLNIRSLKMPESMAQARYYWNEKPIQIGDKRGFAFKAWEGRAGNGKVKFGQDEVIPYRYELVVASPLPPNSPVIERVTWSPKEAIVRKAMGSDNWPLTWADDDHYYTAYGDGWGFEPLLKAKLSLGFARVEGGPTEFQGVNLRSPTGERTGHGKDGKKASGILCFEGVLYLWTRNAGNAQLAWSKDHGMTWEWADWKFATSFGCPTFLNFGKNYAGARDEFVYVYSHDSNSAYTSADRMVLARVPKGKIRNREAYEFFAGLEDNQQPKWSRAIADRSAVFSHTGKCYRSGITYNAGLKRYLWVQIVAGTEGTKGDTRFDGGFAIYDAPEPWGPWTMAYFTEKWDVGPGDTASFPTKWMSADGKTIHLVFSGDDSFSVRKATLTTGNRCQFILSLLPGLGTASLSPWDVKLD